MQNNWGGADSADKRDWFAGHVADSFPSLVPTRTTSSTTTEAAIEEPDTAYIEELLLNVMHDEFEIIVDDDTSLDVAAEIIRLRGLCRAGNFDEVDRLEARWTATQGKKIAFKVEEEKDQDTDWEDEDGSGDEDDEDVEMTDAPKLVEKKEKPEPEVDEDGFTKVTRKR